MSSEFEPEYKPQQPTITPEAQKFQFLTQELIKTTLKLSYSMAKTKCNHKDECPCYNTCLRIIEIAEKMHELSGV